MATHKTDHSISKILGLDLDPPRKRQRRSRTIFPESTIDVLEAAFSENRYPDIKDRLLLAKQIGEEEARVQVWFQNRRARHRRSTKRKSSTASSSASSSPKSSPSSSPPAWKQQLLKVQKAQQFSDQDSSSDIQEVNIHIEERPFIFPVTQPISPLPTTPQTSLPPSPDMLFSPVPAAISPLPSSTPRRSTLMLPLKVPRLSFSIQELIKSELN